jgi:hypothetical protein
LWDDKLISQISYNDLKEKGFDFTQYIIKKGSSDDKEDEVKQERKCEKTIEKVDIKRKRFGLVGKRIIKEEEETTGVS